MYTFLYYKLNYVKNIIIYNKLLTVINIFVLPWYYIPNSNIKIKYR